MNFAGILTHAGHSYNAASPEEIADFFVFMCSDRASYSVGSTYFVDGGMSKAV